MLLKGKEPSDARSGGLALAQDDEGRGGRHALRGGGELALDRERVAAVRQHLGGVVGSRRRRKQKQQQQKKGGGGASGLLERGRCDKRERGEEVVGGAGAKEKGREW